MRVKDLDGERYLSRVNCEYGQAADAVFDAQSVGGPTVYQSERDDWILAMAAAGLGYAFMPALCVDHPGVVARPLVEPEIWREIALVTVRGRPHSPGVGALVQEAMRRAVGRPSPRWRWSRPAQPDKYGLAIETIRTRHFANPPPSRMLLRGDGAHGTAPDPLFSRALRGAELYARGGALHRRAVLARRAPSRR